MYVNRVSPEEALELMKNEGWSYVDVRSVAEFEQGHPSGAYNVPLIHMGPTGSAANPDFLQVMERHFARGAGLVVGCRTANRAEHAVVALHRAGFTNVAIQRAWLFGAERRRQRETEALRRASLALNATLDTDQVMEVLLEQIGWVIPYDSANVMMNSAMPINQLNSRGAL